jgi:hypothetical protein
VGTTVISRAGNGLIGQRVILTTECYDARLLGEGKGDDPTRIKLTSDWARIILALESTAFKIGMEAETKSIGNAGNEEETHSCVISTGRRALRLCG